MVKSSILVVLIVIASNVLGQVNRYAVYFNDKDTVSFDQTSQELFLSQRAIDRRLNQNIPITVEDYPVNETYINSLRASGVDIYYSSKWLNCVIVQSAESQLVGFDFIAKIELVALGERLTKSNENPVVPTSFVEPSKVDASTDFQIELIGADQMHQDGYRGEGMLIAVFDDGFEGVNEFTPFKHLYEKNQIVLTKDFVTNSDDVYKIDDHGTKVLTGLAADFEGEKNTVKGTAPDANYMLFLTEDIKSEYRIEEYNWLIAAEYADSAGVDIINGSLGYSTFREESMNYSIEDLDGNTAISSIAASKASSKGIIVVVSAGNEGNGSWKQLTAPADAHNILSVGSVDAELNKSGFSSFGPSADGRIKPDVSTLGSLATIMLGSGHITTGNGTSFASPQIAGLAAGIWQANPEWTNTQVIEAIRYSSSNALNPNMGIGYGIPNYKIAVKGGTLSAKDILEDELKVYPNPFKENTIYVDLSNVKVKKGLTLRLSDGRGVELFTQYIDGDQKTDEVKISIDNMELGVYFLVLESAKFTKTLKLIKI